MPLLKILEAFSSHLFIFIYFLLPAINPPSVLHKAARGQIQAAVQFNQIATSSWWLPSYTASVVCFHTSAMSYTTAVFYLLLAEQFPSTLTACRLTPHPASSHTGHEWFTSATPTHTHSPTTSSARAHRDVCVWVQLQPWWCQWMQLVFAGQAVPV